MSIVATATDLASGNALEIIATAAATTITSLVGILVAQMSGLRSDLKKLEARHTDEMRELRSSAAATTAAQTVLTGRVTLIENEIGLAQPPTRSTTKGRRPATTRSRT